MPGAQNAYQLAYQHLAEIIAERQQYEAGLIAIAKFQLFSVHQVDARPYLTHKTDANYPDIQGKTLLHYAAAMGDLEKVKAQLAAGANVNGGDNYYNVPSPLALALRNNHLEIAEYLFQQGADCSLIDSRFLSEASKKWFHEKIKNALNESFPHPEKKLIVEKENAFFSKQVSKKQDSPLFRAAEIGDIDFIQKVRKNQYSEYKRACKHPHRTLMVVAAQHGQLQVLEQLIKNGENFNASRDYQTSPLIAAIKHNQQQVVDFLLSQNSIDINEADEELHTAFYYAIQQENIGLIKRLLAKNVNFNKKDVEDNNLLHHLASLENLEIATLLLSADNIKNNLTRLLQEKNIYGETPIDIALQNKNNGVLNLFLPNSRLSAFSSLPGYGEKSVSIDQGSVMDKMYYYLKSQYRDTDLFNKEGNCVAFEFLFLFYNAQNMKEYFFSTLALMSAWDGQEKSLNKPFKDIPQAKFYKNLGELFEQWIQDITWFQVFYKTLKYPSKEEKLDRYNYNMVGNNIDYQPILLYREKTDLLCSSEQIQEILNYIARMPEKTQFEFMGEAHATGMTKIANSTFTYYDSNFNLPTTSITTSRSLFLRMMNYKFINLGMYKDKLNLEPIIFYFKKDENILDLKHFQILSDAEMPKNKEEAQQFQDKSPNLFTPLHIAIITRSFATLIRALADQYCDIGARDIHNRTALDIALDNDYREGIEMLLKSPQLNWENINPEKFYEKNLTDLLLKYAPHNGLQKLLYAAAKKGDLELVKKLILEKKINIKESLHGVFVLNRALELNNEPMVKMLLEEGVSITGISEGRTPLSLAISSSNQNYYSLILNRLKDIDETDNTGKGAIHYAVRERRPFILENLIKRGANFALLDRHGKTALDYLDVYSASTFKKEGFRENRLLCARLLYQHFPFNLMDSKDKKVLFRALCEYSEHGDDELYRIILARCNRDIINTKENEELPLARAVGAGELTKVSLLLEAGAKPEAYLLIWLINEKDFPQKHAMVKLFLNYKVDINEKNEEGISPLDVLDESHDPELKDLFLQAGLISDLPKLSS